MGTKGGCVQREESGGPLSPVCGAYTRPGLRMRRLKTPDRIDLRSGVPGSLCHG